MQGRKVLAFVLSLVFMLSLLVAPSFAQDQPVTLHVMHWTPTMDGTTDWWNEIVSNFEAAHPGVTIENNFVPFAQYLPTLESMIAGEQLPDVFFGHVKSAELGRGGLAVNYKDYFDQEFFDQFYPGPLKQFTFDGNIYAIPWTAQLFGVFVNPAILSEVGVEAPQTWDDLIAMSPALNDAGYIPLAWGNQAANVCPDFVLPIMAQEGADVYALDDLSSPDLSWDSEPVINALTLLKDMVDANVFMPGVNGVTEALGQQAWYQGQAAMMFTGSFMVGAGGITDLAPEELVNTYTVIKTPALTADGPHLAGDGSGEGWVVNANSPSRDLALEFVKYLSSPEAVALHISATQDMPAIKSGLDSLQNEKVREMTSWLQTDGADHILFGQGSWDAVAGVCSSILDGSISPTDGAAKIQADVLAARAR